MAVEFLPVHLPPCHLNLFFQSIFVDHFFWQDILFFALVFPEVSISLYQFHEQVLKNAAQNFFSLIRSKGVTVVSQLVGYKI